MIYLETLLILKHEYAWLHMKAAFIYPEKI